MSRSTRPLHASILNVLVLAAFAAGTALVAGPAAARTITVDTTLDADATDGVCSLREAILAANTDDPHNDCPGGDGEDRIVFDVTTPAAIVLTADLPKITENLMIRGPGVPLLAIDGGDVHRLLHFDTPGNDGWFGVERLTLYRGRSPGGASGDGGGAYVDLGETGYFHRVHFLENRSGNAGGGLGVGSSTGALQATATVVECLFESNVAEGPGGGGGLAVVGTGGVVNVVRSTLTGNLSIHENGPAGGAIVFRGTLVLDASTVSGNSANSSGGGILAQVSGTPPLSGALLVRNSTITRNLANADAIEGDVNGDGGGIYTSVTPDTSLSLTIENSVVAGNFDPEGTPATGAAVHPDLTCDADLQGVASGSSFIGSNQGCEALFPAGSPNASGDWVGSAGAELDPVLRPLADYGGPLPTHLPDATVRLNGLLAISPLIDAGNCPAAGADQRGFGDEPTGVRRYDHPGVPDAPGSDGCDIGAVEADTVRIERILFADGFESGNTLLWSNELEVPSPALTAGGQARRRTSSQ